MVRRSENVSLEGGREKFTGGSGSQTESFDLKIDRRKLVPSLANAGGLSSTPQTGAVARPIMSVNQTSNGEASGVRVTDEPTRYVTSSKSAPGSSGLSDFVTSEQADADKDGVRQDGIVLLQQTDQTESRLAESNTEAPYHDAQFGRIYDSLGNHQTVNIAAGLARIDVEIDEENLGLERVTRESLEKAWEGVKDQFIKSCQAAGIKEDPFEVYKYYKIQGKVFEVLGPPLPDDQAVLRTENLIEKENKIKLSETKGLAMCGEYAILTAYIAQKIGEPVKLIIGSAVNEFDEEQVRNEHAYLLDERSGIFLDPNLASKPSEFPPVMVSTELVTLETLEEGFDVEARRIGTTFSRFYGLESGGFGVRKKQKELPDLRQENLELLHNAGEVGESVIPYYEYALRLAPELSTIGIIRNDNLLPYATRSFIHGLHRVMTPMGSDTPKKLLDLIPDSSLARIAESLGMKPGELKQRPDLLYIHAVIHELGHTLQYKQYENDPEAFEEQRQKEINDLPIPNQNDIGELIGALKDTNSNVSIWVRENWDALQATYGAQNIQELIEIQSNAKRNLFNEKFADDFAARVLKGVEEEKEVKDLWL